MRDTTKELFTPRNLHIADNLIANEAPKKPEVKPEP
jgi:hypothetical protein